MPKTKKCEHCGKNINERYSVCPICGGHVKENINTLLPMCPRCIKPLKVIKKDGEECDVCPSCGGLWLDRIKFHRATTQYNVFKQTDYKTEYRKTPSKDPEDYIPCVRCGKLMMRKNFRRISGVIIDRCTKHGVWLDNGEIEKIRHFIADGGLDRARDREIQKNRDEIRQLASNFKTVKFTQRLIHLWNPKRWLFTGWK